MGKSGQNVAFNFGKIYNVNYKIPVFIIVGIFLFFTLINSEQEAYSHTEIPLGCATLFDENCFDLGNKIVCDDFFPFTCRTVDNEPKTSILENWVFKVGSRTPCGETGNSKEVVKIHTSILERQLKIFYDCDTDASSMEFWLQRKSEVELQKDNLISIRSMLLYDEAKFTNFGKFEGEMIVSTGTQVINNGEILLRLDKFPKITYVDVEGKIINNKKFVIGPDNKGSSVVVAGGGAFENNDELEIKTHRKIISIILAGNQFESPCPDPDVEGDLCFKFEGGLTIRGILDNFFDIINTGSIDIGARNVHTNQKSVLKWGNEHIPGWPDATEGNPEKLLVNKKDGLIKNLPGGIIDNQGVLINEGYIEIQCGSTLKNSGAILNNPGGVIAGVSELEGTPIEDKGTLQDPAFTVDECEPDVEPPVIILQDLTVECNEKLRAMVDLGTIATDNRHPNPKVTPDLEGIPFPLGTTPVEWTATDGVRLQSMKTTKVTVEDTTPPEMTPPPDVIVKSNVAKVPSNTVNLGNPTVTDICAFTFMVEVRNDAPQNFEPGETIVTWTAKDPSENISSVTQKVLVVPEDDDGDGIADIVDTLPQEFSNDFEDVPIGGETDGEVIDRGDQVIVIF